MRRTHIESRQYSTLESALSDLKRIYDAGFSADFINLMKEPVHEFGISIGHYYEIHIFRWEESE